MNEQGFYKKQDGQLLYAANYVEGNEYILLIQEKDIYDYPMDGWIYAESAESAREILA